MTEDVFEIDVVEAQYPSYERIDLQIWPTKGDKNVKHTGSL
jgi:hypothetical protein